MSGPREGRPYRRSATEAIAAARLAGDPCWLCSRPIDYTKPRGHPASPSADHVDPLVRGGDVLGPLMVAHLICNVRRQGKRRDEVDFDRPLEWDSPRRDKVRPKHSTDWW